MLTRVVPALRVAELAHPARSKKAQSKVAVDIRGQCYTVSSLADGIKTKTEHRGGRPRFLSSAKKLTDSSFHSREHFTDPMANDFAQELLDISAATPSDIQAAAQPAAGWLNGVETAARSLQQLFVPKQGHPAAGRDEGTEV